jgi:twinkle protein
VSSSKEVSRGPCPQPDCDTDHGNVTFDDGHTHCYACDTTVQPERLKKPDPLPTPAAQRSKLLKNLQPFKKEWCGITVETLNFFSYCQAFYREQQVHVATYNDQQGLPCAQHLRFRDKRFIWISNDGISNLQFWAQSKWRQNHGRESNVFCVITEGEKDCMSVSQVQGNKFPVVSLPSGTQSVKKAIGANLKWLSQFAWVVICFDNDTPGIQASQTALELLPAGKAAICRIPDPYKDANDMLVDGKGAELKDLLWKAVPSRPDSIKEASTLWDVLIEPNAKAIVHLPWTELNEKCRGFRSNEMWCIAAGSGTGKSTVCRELAYHFLSQNLKVGYIALEESLKRSLQGIVGVALNKPLHLDESVEIPIIKSAFDSLLGSGRLFLYDHFGSCNPDTLIEKITYLATVEEVDVVILDHLTIVVSGIADLDERRALDVTCTKLRQCVESTGIGLIIVSHLRRPEGKGHEEGVKVSLNHLRGSHSIAQLSDMVISCSRNQSGDAGERSQLQLGVLKNRFSGSTGDADTLLYDEKTGRLVQQTTFFQ